MLFVMASGLQGLQLLSRDGAGLDFWMEPSLIPLHSLLPGHKPSCSGGSLDGGDSQGSPGIGVAPACAGTAGGCCGTLGTGK